LDFKNGAGFLSGPLFILITDGTDYKRISLITLNHNVLQATIFLLALSNTDYQDYLYLITTYSFPHRQKAAKTGQNRSKPAT
jgi:hypothetical protein